MKCRYCGEELNQGDLFCANCGTKVENGSDTTVVIFEGPQEPEEVNPVPPGMPPCPPVTGTSMEDLPVLTGKEKDFPKKPDIPSVSNTKPENLPTPPQRKEPKKNNDRNRQTRQAKKTPENPAATNKKSSKSIILAAVLAGVLVLAGGAGFFLLNGSSDGLKLSAIIEENTEYTALADANIYNSKKEVIGRISKDEYVFLIESGADENGDEWGVLEGGSYIKMSSGSERFLTKIDKTADAVGQSSANGDGNGNSQSQPESGQSAQGQTGGNNSSDSSQNSGSQSVQEAANPSQPQASESYIVKEQYVPYILTSREKTNYSGAAVAQSILDTHFYNKPQAEIARDLGIDQAGITDYRKLASYISENLGRTYTPVLFDPNEVSKAEMQTCLNRLVQALDGWSLPVVNFSPAGFIDQPEDMYAIVCGYSLDSNGNYRFKLYLPHSEPVEIEISSDELLNRMLAPKYFCYLY